MNELQVRNSEMPERKLRTVKKKRKWFSSFMVLVILSTVYLLINIFISLGSYSIYTINRGEYEDVVTGEGYIFRNQKLINSPTDGFLDCRVSENERVALGAEIASVYNKMPSDEVVASLKKIDSEISSLRIARIKDTTYSTDAENTQNYAAEIKSAVAYGYTKDFVGIAEIAENINRDIQKSKVSDDSSDSAENNSSGSIEEEMIAGLKAQREKLISENGMTSTSIIAETAGVFSSKIDGLEDSLAIENLDGITPSYIKNLNEPKTNSENNAIANTPVCKIINNFEWYYASVIPIESAKTLSVNQNVSLRFFDITNNLISGRITYISPEENGEAVVVIKSNKHLDSIYTISATNADIVKNKYSGLKIPKDGIRVVDNQTGIYVLRNGVARFVKVEVIYNSSDWAIIKEDFVNDGSSVRIYDELILNAKDLYDGKIMEN